MASTSTSHHTQRSSSPPPSTPLPPPPQSSLRVRLSPQEAETPPRSNYLEERSRKRRRIEESQDKSLLHGFVLRPHAAKILESNDLSSLQDAINDLIKSKNATSQTILHSLALHYPNALSFKLAKLLQSHPPLQIRTETVSLLRHILTSDVKMNSSILIELKIPLLHSLKVVESEESLIPLLCEITGLVAARLYEYHVGGWEELLEYVCTCVSGGDESNHTKGLKLIAELPMEVVENREFWLDQGNYNALFENILKLVDLPDQKFQVLTFDASMTLMIMSKELKRTEVCDSLLPIILRFIDRHAEEEIVVNKVRLLTDLVTLDIGKIFEGKERDVFWCMIRLAEVKGASEELRCVAVVVLKELDELKMDAMQSLIHSLSREEVKRIFSVAMGMMSCVVDDPLWYEVDDKECQEAGMTETFSRGKFLLNWLSFEGDEGVVVPTVIEMITMVYAPHRDWRVRYAAMLAIGTIAAGHFKGDMIRYLEQVVSLVLKSLNELNHRVLWATMHAIKCLSGYKEQLKQAQYHVKFLAKLVPIIKYSLCARVQVYTVIAIRSLVTSCGFDKILSIADEIVALLIVLLKHQKQKLQEEAIETLASIAVLIPITFRQSYYDITMKTLKDILFDDYSSPKLFLRAKCLECMGNLVRKIEQDKFKDQEADQVMESLVSLEGKLSNTDYLTRTVILKALDQFCRCPKVNVDRFINKVMPMLLGSAQLDTDLTAEMPTGESLDDSKIWVESARVRACYILSHCAARSSKRMSPHIDKVTKIFVRWLGCSSFETRKASVSALPNILLSIKVSVHSEMTKRALTDISVRALIEELQQETDSALSKRMLRLLPKCIQTSGSFITSQLIKMIADEIKRILKMAFEIETERADQQAGTSEGGSESLPPTEEIIQDGKYLLSTTIDTFKARFLPYVDDLMTNVALFLVEDIPDRLIAIALSVFNIIVPRFPSTLPKYHNKYVCTACHLLREDYPHGQLDATRAIGICAKLGGHRFKITAAVGISRLYDILIKRPSITLCDAAVAALGKICEFHRSSTHGPTVVKNWLSFLPVKSDFNEARYAHGLLSKMIARSDKHLFGRDNENLPKIISVVKEILSRPDRLATEEAIKKMTDFINQHGGMEYYMQGPKKNKHYMPTG